MALAVSIVFIVVLLVIALEKIHRTKVAMIGAGIVLIMGGITEEHAIEAVDWGTIGLLAGMMLIVAVTQRTGIFTYIAVRAAQLSRGEAWRLVFILAFTTGILSGFLDNLTAILLVVPITLLLADVLRLPAIPLVLLLIIASNIGGAATLIGDPPNILIGSAVPELSFMDFIINLAPIAFISLFIVTGAIYLVLRSRLKIAPEDAAEVAKLQPGKDLQGSPNLKRAIAVVIGTVIGFFLHSQLGLEPWVIALAGATVMLLVAVDDIEEALGGIEWATLFFFMALFVMVGALEQQGIIESIAELVADASGDSSVREGMIVLWTAAAGSAVVDNIPFTAAMIPVVEELQREKEQFDDGTWWALALGASFGGNATIIAAAANVAATGVMAKAGHPVSFLRFMLIGIPATIISLILATIYLLLFQL